MAELLFELGCEELPASFVRKAYGDLQAHLVQLLGEAQLLEDGFKAQSLGTPRRLIVGVTGIKTLQPDISENKRGPALEAAFDASGNPTPALLGFCRGAGVDVANVTKDDKYVWAEKVTKGAPTAELLQAILPDAIRKLAFDKSMRWGSGKMRFARPIRWILANFEGKPVTFQIESVTSGATSIGHRFYANKEFTSATWDEHLSNLRKHKVEPDVDIRIKMITDQSKQASGNPLLDEDLVDENAFLTEWPDAVHGEFKAEYLHLPRPVLVTAMAKHEKMFPVEDASGNLTNKFVFIRNGGDDATVKAGNAWVLNARFNDARFFYNQDSELTLDDFLAKTENLMFGRDLGTVYQRVERLVGLAEQVSEVTGATAEEIAYAKKAAKYAKADLSSRLVSELPPYRA